MHGGADTLCFIAGRRGERCFPDGREGKRVGV
jgi:hypothetical protein